MMNEQEYNPDMAEAADCVCFNLRKSARAVTQLYDAALKPSGLRATQFSLLAKLHGVGPLTISKLAKALVMDRTTLTRNLLPVEKDGLVAVVPGRDRRSRQVRLTARGRTRLAAALPLWRRAQSRVVGALGEARSSHLLGELAATIDATRPG